MNVPKDLHFTTTHEWVRVRGDIAVVGITDFAQQQLSDLTFVELPEAGDEVAKDEEVAVVESVKAASDIYAPLGGTIAEINERVVSQPDRVNTDPYGEGWLFKIRMGNADETRDLLTADQYEEQLPEEE